MQFKMYSAVGRYRKNSYGGNSNPMGFGRECFSSMSAKIFGGGGGGRRDLPTPFRRLWPNFAMYSMDF